MTEIKYLTEEDYQKQSLVVQKSSASFLANCTPLVTLSVKRWQIGLKHISKPNQHRSANKTTRTSSRVPSSCMSPSICSTNSSVNRIFAETTRDQRGQKKGSSYTQSCVCV